MIGLACDENVTAAPRRLLRRPRTLLLVTPFALVALSVVVAQAPARNVVLVTIDGVRPQEVFLGASPELLSGAEDSARLTRLFGGDDVESRRRALMPFLWGTLAQQGQLFGNEAASAPMRLTNDRHCSYPGYNELLTGKSDPRIEGNGHPANPNVTVFEWLNAHEGLAGRVQAFATWGTFFRIFNVERSRLDVRAGWEPPFARDARRTPTKDALDLLYRTITPTFGNNALDAVTWAALKESLQTDRPRVLFLGLGEADEWAHTGRYDLVLEALHRADAIVADLWRTLQQLDEYKDSTALIVTTDHGRGVDGEGWKEHGASVRGSDQVWLGALGPGVPALGERKDLSDLTTSQVASTLALLLGHDWLAASPEAGAPLPLVPPEG